MIRLIGLWLVGWTLFVTPVAADEGMYDGPTAIKPLTVTPQPQHSAPPNTVCDFEHQCYPEKSGPEAPAPVAPPAIVVKPVTPRPQVPDEPIVATWRDCMDRGLQTLPSDLWPHDQDHYGGLSANDALAQCAMLRPGSRVADFCAGLGGPARYYAHVYGAEVTAIELTPARAAGAKRLNHLVGLTDRVRVVQGDVVSTELPDGEMDAVVS